jgi:hypothetical protein
MRLRRITFHRHTPAWRERFFYAELIAKGATVDVSSATWEVRW